MLANHQLDALFLATIQAVEESILNALVAAETMTGMHGNKVHALPRDQVRSLLRQAGARRGFSPSGKTKNSTKIPVRCNPNRLP